MVQLLRSIKKHRMANVLNNVLKDRELSIKQSKQFFNKGDDLHG